MKPLSSAPPRNDRQPDGAQGTARRHGLRAFTFVAVAAAILAFGIADGRSKPAHAGDHGLPSTPAASRDEATHQDFVKEIQRPLKADDDRLIALAGQVLDAADSTARLRDQAIRLPFDVKRAESEYLNAKLAREVAEIAFKEYTEATSVVEKATRDGELKLAKADLERARRDTAEAKERLARITALSDRSARGLDLDYTYSDRLKAAELDERRATLAVEQAESNRNVMLGYIALLDRAIPIEEQAHTRLDQLVKEGKSSDVLQKEVRDLANQLGAIVDRAEAAKAAADFARLKPRIQRTARR
jgi:hypothetical protein